MGKKKNRGLESGSDVLNEVGEADRSVKYVSAAAAARREAVEADKGGNMEQPDKKSKKQRRADADMEEDKEGEMIQSAKQRKRGKKHGGEELDDDAFEKVGGNEKDNELIAAKGGENDVEPTDDVDAKGQPDEDAAGGGAFAQGAARDVLAGAFDDVDSDELHDKGYGKSKKSKKHEKKKKNKKQDGDEDEEPAATEEPKPQAVEEEQKVPEVAAEGQDGDSQKDEGDDAVPLVVLYCKQCGLPPEYCTFGQKDASACQEWLRTAHPALFNQIYPDQAVEVTESSGQIQQDGAADEGAEPNEAGQPSTGEKQVIPGEEDKENEGEAAKEKPKKKVKFGKDSGIINVIKLKRGGRKILCQMTGFEHYTKDLKALASKFGKKFSCGCNVAQDDIYGECISVQGDVEDRLLEYLETDKDMVKLGIPPEKIQFEDKGNKKGRKRV